jgi:hypothetical protein
MIRSYSIHVYTEHGLKLILLYAPKGKENELDF